MSASKVVNVVLCRRSDGKLDLFGVFKSRSNAGKRIAESLHGNEVSFFESNEFEHLIDPLNDDQGWDIILKEEDSNENVSIDSVWGYCIKETIQ